MFQNVLSVEMKSNLCYLVLHLCLLVVYIGYFPFCSFVLIVEVTWMLHFLTLAVKLFS